MAHEKYWLLYYVAGGKCCLDLGCRDAYSIEVDVLRDRNQLYRENIEGQIENAFTLKLVNKSQQDQTYRIEVKGFEQFELIGETTKDVSAGEVGTMPVTLAVPPTLLDGQVTEFYFVVTAVDNADITTEHQSRFLYE